MSAMGYGSRFESQTPQPMPFPGMASRTSAPSTIPGVNFNPDATTPAADPDKYLWGHETTYENDLYKRALGAMTGLPTSKTRPVYETGPWQNPIANYFGGFGSHQNLQGLDSKRVAMGGSYDPNDLDRFKTTPHNSKDLYNQMYNLSANNLLELNNQGLGDIQNRFQRTAQDYSNLYANENYGTTFKDGYSGFSQKENSMWLQAAYNRLMKSMDEGYLL